MLLDSVHYLYLIVYTMNDGIPASENAINSVSKAMLHTRCTTAANNVPQVPIVQSFETQSELVSKATELLYLNFRTAWGTAAMFTTLTGNISTVGTPMSISNGDHTPWVNITGVCVYRTPVGVVRGTSECCHTLCCCCMYHVPKGRPNVS